METFRSTDGDDCAEHTALVRKIESTATVPLTALRDSEEKLHFLIQSVNGLPWALHASFLLPDIHTYPDMVNSLLHALRTITTYAATD